MAEVKRDPNVVLGPATCHDCKARVYLLADYLWHDEKGVHRCVVAKAA